MGYDREQVVRSLRGFIESFFEQYAAAHGKVRWADKTPNYVDCLDELWELFGPEARFILIIRHGMDVAFSLADPRRHYPVLDPYVTAAGGDVSLAAGRFWVHQNRKILSFQAAHPDACFEIRYEDLTTDPVAALEPLFSFLGEPWEPAVVDYARFPHDAGLEGVDVRRFRRIVANSGNYREWPRKVQDAVREVCEPLLTELSYGEEATPGSRFSRPRPTRR